MAINTMHSIGVPEVDDLPAVFPLPGARNGTMTGAELRAIRIGMGLTQTQLGAVVGHAQAVVSVWEKSEKVPDAICDAVLSYGEWLEAETLRRASLFENSVPGMPIAHLEKDLSEPYTMQHAVSTGRALLRHRLTH